MNTIKRLYSYIDGKKRHLAGAAANFFLACQLFNITLPDEAVKWGGVIVVTLFGAGWADAVRKLRKQ